MMDDKPKNYIKPRDFTSAELLRQREPYSFQRDRHRASYPRPAQPNTNQPNASIRKKPTMQREYWDDHYRRYLESRKGGSDGS
jgi:hypothetical protein